MIFVAFSAIEPDLRPTFIVLLSDNFFGLAEDIGVLFEEKVLLSDVDLGVLRVERIEADYGFFTIEL